MKFNNTLTKLVRRDIDSNLIPMLLGEPGIGKSSWVMALADSMHTQCFVLACNQLADKADLTGARLVPILDAEGNTVDYKQVFYPHAVISDAIAYAEANPRETPILFMDELNRTTPDVTSEALSIPTLRAIGSKKLPNNLRVVTAGNDKGNITSLDTASISRFVLYHVEPDAQTFLGLDDELNPFVRNVLTAHPECIFGKGQNVIATGDHEDGNEQDVYIEDIIDDGEEMSQLTTPRTISGVSRWLNGFTNAELMEMMADTRTVDGVEVSVLQEALEGHVGSTNFCNFLLAEIANNVMNTSTQATAMTVGKPATYDEMKACPDVRALDDFIATMSDNDKSGCLLYAIYEPANNVVYIRALADSITRLMPNDMKTLMKLSASDKLDSENVRALLATNTELSRALTIILEG